MKNKFSINFYLGFILVAILVSIMIVSFFYTPYDVTEMNISERFLAPNIQHWLGTDNFGRDILSRIMEGTQTAFLVGLIAVSIGFVFGTIIGGVSGYMGGIMDEIIMRIMDAMMALPGLLFALMFVAIFGVGIFNTMVALGIMAIPSFARIARSGFMQAKQLEYIKSAKAMGVGSFRIMFVHILPNTLSPLVVAASMGFASAVLAEAGLSFLGLGVQPPYPSWGWMLKESQVYLSKAPVFVLAPGCMISVAVLGFNLLGDGIRDLRDPRR